MRVLAEDAPERLARGEHLEYGALGRRTAATARHGIAADPNPPVHHAPPKGLPGRGTVGAAIGQVNDEIGLSFGHDCRHAGPFQVAGAKWCVPMQKDGGRENPLDTGQSMVECLLFGESFAVEII